MRHQIFHKPTNSARGAEYETNRKLHLQQSSATPVLKHRIGKLVLSALIERAWVAATYRYCESVVSAIAGGTTATPSYWVCSIAASMAGTLKIRAAPITSARCSSPHSELATHCEHRPTQIRCRLWVADQSPVSTMFLSLYPVGQVGVQYLPV